MEGIALSLPVVECAVCFKPILVDDPHKERLVVKTHFGREWSHVVCSRECGEYMMWAANALAECRDDPTSPKSPA